MSPQPISLAPGTKICWDMDAAEAFRRAPQLAVLYGTAVANWGFVESWYGNLMCLLNLDNETFDLSKFQNVRSSAEQRRRVLKAAEKALPDELRPLFDQGFSLVTAPAADRNDIVHGIVGYSESFPDALLILRPEHLQTLFKGTFAEALKTKTVPEDFDAKMRECARHLMRYGQRELEEIVKASERSQKIVFELYRLCSGDADAIGVGALSLAGLLQR